MTIVAYGLMVHRALDAAATLAKEGIEAEVIDLRTLSPLDMDTVLESVENTGRLVVVDEASPRCNIATDISAQVAQQGVRRAQGRHRDGVPAAYAGAVLAHASRTCISPAPRMSWKRCARPR
ncbi:transketolase C-terminal domain-containing protein [Cupriavidus basilensis]